MLDCHIIVSHDTPAEWVARCLHTTHTAANHAGYPVAVRLAPFFAGHIGQSRAAGYAMGTHPYVTCVDDDDWLEPDAFACLRDAMKARAPAIYTREFQHQNDTVRETNLRQHLRVFRRGVIAGFDFDRWPALDSTALIAHADAQGVAVELPNRVYHYQVRRDSGARRIKDSLPLLSAAGHALGPAHEVRHV